ncbi:hypothetical protein IG611_01555 [Pectobacterium sp. A535-S3-A17]|uniref:hypothetical protein n=1 Tax=Pectobacterium quasiaquaticum TaxID=2774015 RepID=UPI0018744DC1|nr:hypothetical protein [Pectobacterium quasiaquaticum]MBE5213276.1 hypothetical protein [Pectobacterium quasiaquaticum]MBE5224074.1 hypothetical protein [Pectobacterium quasiaquaticum]
MPLTFQRIVELSKGGEPAEGETQELAELIINIATRAPRPVSYQWRWREYVMGCSHEWQFSAIPVNHIDVECRLVYDIPEPENIKNAINNSPQKIDA